MNPGFTHGIFVISLDFELHWGVSEKKTVAEYRENLDHTREGIARMLQLFEQYDIHVTWATVGFLFCKNKEDLISRSKNIEQPKYLNSRLSNYNLFSQIGKDYKDDPYHYGNDMIPLIRSCPNQEIGSHTFSHYYCLEKNASFKSFSDDLDAAIGVAEKEGLKINSIVFPRNQYSREHLGICLEKGIQIYRGNSSHWLYRPLSSKDQHYIRRLGRLLDSYINLSGKNCFELIKQTGELINVPASRFLRPYHSKLRFLESVRLSRIKNEMNFAAKEKKLYHLWWHPHNFGKHLEENMHILKKILEYYKFLKENYSFASLNMLETAKHIK